MVDNPNGVLAFRDEIVSLLRTLDREENASAKGFYLTGWSGQESYTFDRIIRKTKRIEIACISLLGSAQPGMIAEYVRRVVEGDEADDGMIQRFSMLVWPGHSTDWREVDHYPDREAKESAWKTFDRLDALDWQKQGALKDAYYPIPYLHLDDEAQEIFSAWRRELEMRLRGDGLSPALQSHFAKYRKLVPALALVNHMARETQNWGAVPADALNRAIAFSRYLETHARRVYAAGTEGEASAANAIIARIRAGDLSTEFSARDVYRNRWSNLANADQAKAGLDLLVEIGWLVEKRARTGGRPAANYLINPKTGLCNE